MTDLATSDSAKIPSGPKKKICCACPDTKGKRDECVALFGPEAEQCQRLIEAHKVCLRAEGFKKDTQFLELEMPADGNRKTVRSKHGGHLSKQIRDECLQRVQEQREKLLQQCRRQSVRECLQTVFTDVTKNVQPSSIDIAASTSSSSCSENPSKGEAQAISWQGKSRVKDHQHLSEDEQQELLAQMEAALFEEGYRDEFEAIQADELQDISDMFSAHCLVDLAKQDSASRVLCPVCEQADLVESAFGSISCPLDSFSIDAPMQGVSTSLDCLKDSIIRSKASHSASCCRHKPQFFVKTIQTCNLYMVCYECGALDVIM